MLPLVTNKLILRDLKAIVSSSGEIIGTCEVRTKDQENQQASFGIAIAIS